jgi:hypothetical protein
LRLRCGARPLLAALQFADREGSGSAADRAGPALEADPLDAIFGDA